MQKALKILAKGITPDNEEEIKQAIQILACYDDVKKDILSSHYEMIAVSVAEINDDMPYSMIQSKISFTRNTDDFTEVYNPPLPTDINEIVTAPAKIKIDSVYKDFSLVELMQEYKAIEFATSGAYEHQQEKFALIRRELHRQIKIKIPQYLQQIDFS